MSSKRSAVTANGTGLVLRTTKSRSWPDTHAGSASTSRTMTAVCALPSSGVHSPSHVSTSVGAGAAADRIRSRGYVWRAAWASSVARPEPGSPIAATTLPLDIACSARLTAAFHGAESVCRVPEPGSRRGISTRNT
jgi:hypothetical protein